MIQRTGDLRGRIIKVCCNDIRHDPSKTRWNFWRLLLPDNRAVLDEIIDAILKKGFESDRVVCVETSGALLGGIVQYRLSSSNKRPFSILRPGVLPLIKPDVNSSQNISLLDDVSVTGTTSKLAKDSIELKYKGKLKESIAIISLDPYPIGTTEKTPYDFDKLKNHIAFIVKPKITTEFGIKKQIYEGSPIPSSFKTNLALPEQTRIEEICAKKDSRGDITSWSSWNIYNHPVEFVAICEHLAQICSRCMCNTVLSLSVWAHPFAAVVSYLTRLPLVVIRDWSIWSIRPSLDLLPNVQKIFAVDTVSHTGSKLEILEDMKLLPSNREYHLQPITEIKAPKRRVGITLFRLPAFYEIR